MQLRSWDRAVQVRLDKSETLLPRVFLQRQVVWGEVLRFMTFLNSVPRDKGGHPRGTSSWYMTHLLCESVEGALPRSLSLCLSYFSSVVLNTKSKSNLGSKEFISF